MKKTARNTLISIIVVVVCLGIMIAMVRLIKTGVISSSKGSSENESYSVTIKVYDSSSVLAINDTFKYNEGDTLLKLMNEKYTLVLKKDTSGTMVLGINDYVTDWQTSYFALYVNGVYAISGSETLRLTADSIYEWKWMTI